MATEKKDPTVKSSTTTPTPPVPIHEAADYAGNKVYKDMPDKPHPDTVAQIEILPEDRDR